MRPFLIALAIATVPLAVTPALAGSDQSAETKALPGLFVKQGETWFFKVVDGQPADARRGEADEKPGPDEIKVSLDGGNMIVLNGSRTAYNYQAFIAGKPADKGQRTSVCTLLPGVTAFENWPGRLPGIRIANFKDAGGGMICA